MIKEVLNTDILFVIPAQAGIPRFQLSLLDAGFRRHDDMLMALAFINC